MVTKEEYIKVIGQLIAQPAQAWKNDPFEELLKLCPKNIFDKYVDPMAEDVTPSTSEDVRTVNFDARVQFSKILGGIYLDLSELLKCQRDSIPDEYHLVSLQDAALIRKSFEFFLLTGILPFLEPGVGLGAAARSTFIKSWKVYDGKKEACQEKLHFAGKVIVALLGCNDALTVQFLPKFIDDILCVRYQLLELGVEDYEPQIEVILSKCPIDIYFGALMFLTQDKKPNLTPKWMKVACGKQMTKILVAKDGLSHLLQYYKERAGDNWTDNLPMTKQVAWHLATVPKLFKHPRQYHEIIANQFFETFWGQKTVEKNILAVFNCYVEELRVRFSLNCDLTIFDRLLRFWEILNKKIVESKCSTMSRVEDFSPRHIRNLQLLSEVLPSADTKRIRGIFTCLFACIELPHVKGILKASLENVGNLGISLYHHIMTPTQPIQMVKQKKKEPLIQEMGEEEQKEEPFFELWMQGVGNVDEGVAARLECVFFIVDNVLSQTQNRSLLEMISVGLDDFLKTSEKERDDDAARFVALDAAKQFSSIHAHLVVGACYERLVSICTDSGFSSEECLHVLQISNSILNNATIKFNRFAHRKEQVDVFRLTELEEKELEATRNTAKMSLPMMTTIIFLMQTSQRYHDQSMKSLEAMANFTKAVDVFPTEDRSFNMAVEEVKKMLREFKIDANQINPPQQPLRGSERRRYSCSQVDLCAEWMEDLHDDEPATRGGTLMLIAKSFRTRNYICNRLIDYGAFDMAKELVVDDDSYVYLAAINCLCEMGYSDSRLFVQVLEYFEELSNIVEKSEMIVMRLGRVAEAMGRLVEMKGEVMITHFDRMATVFMKGMQENDEIVRASSCGAFGNLLVATSGRGVEKWAQQLFHVLTNLLKIDRALLVRRSAIDLIRQCLKACGADVLGILRENLLDIHREVNRLMRTDRDETVRLHAQLCTEELDAALRQNYEATERSYSRKIKF